MTTIDSIKPGAAFGLGFLLSGVNPKNLLLNVAGALAIAQAPLNSTQTLVAAVLYILLASVTIIGPVVYYQVAGANAEKVLNEMKRWLIQNNTAVMAVLLLVFGVKNVGEFIGAVL
jgi:threonine/homoserine/homoserine lactone efflux protein